MSLKTQWAGWSAQYAGRNRREKIILFVAALAVTYAAVDALWLTPSLTRWQAAQKLAASKQREVVQLQGQIDALAAQSAADRARVTAALAAASRDVTLADAELTALQETLVPAAEMTALLRSLLPGRALEVIRLRTLAPESLTAAAPMASGEAAAPAPVANGPGLFRHGIEVTLAGSFPALADYVQSLENSPKKVIWSRLDLESDGYPRNRLTLVVHTLSMSDKWLAL